ncbi:Rpn family recombination-promoting nuclease/putative transposase [Shouchella shacheensis]|uniref:Rpn family recombination-promoting nuclease/putative transposase n=1 Tax=Shouchella shacheensis TaxID=1649580 RepID=UPI0007403136|nr:Rpn family recombination-promoting nuclease/putative transposase [Shouchella shacheensis]
MTLTTIAREESTSYTDHDQLFKQLIHSFFAEFLELFFPEVHEEVDFRITKPLSEELFTDLIEGERRRLDIVIETKLKGQNTFIIVHVEPQSYGQSHFHERMYHYFSLLYHKYRKPIVPIAVFTYDENRQEQDHFTMSFPFFHVLTFQFLKLELRTKNWRDYLDSENPVAAALLSKMGYTKAERVQVKKEFLRMLVKLELDPAKSALINGFFEKYLSLNQSEEEALMEEIHQLSKDEEELILKLPNSWIEKGERKGTKNVALEMLKKGLDPDLIAEVTKLDREEIENLRETL